MNISSAQPNFSITSDNSHTGFIAQDIGTIVPDTIVLTGTNTYSSGTVTVDLSGVGASGSYYTVTGSGSEFVWKNPEEWVDCFPDYNKVKEMCDQYPAFKIAFEKFKQMYDLVEDDYTSKKGNKYAP